MASNGFWGSYYVFCWSNTAEGGASCQGVPSTWSGAGGTSFASPILAAIQALANQATGERWGNPNTVYYSLASTEYGSTGSSTCNSTTVAKTGSTCIFYDITQGDIDSICKKDGSTYYNCYSGGSTNGIETPSSTAASPVAYSTTTGWDFATGIGSVNAYNLVAGFEATAAAAKSHK
jgi:subtilase family serine protease